MDWNVPNRLTVARIFLAAIFFVLLGLYSADSLQGPTLLTWAFVIYLIAGITDILDGYLARKWDQTSTFGRMVDPICDKVLVCGGFVMLAGQNFGISHHADILTDTELGLPAWVTGNMSTAVQPWMAVVVLAREFIISGIRGYSESKGLEFPANQVGKMKMLTQSVAICAVMAVIAWWPESVFWAFVKISLVWLAVGVTAFSGYYYINAARKLLRGS